MCRYFLQLACQIFTTRERETTGTSKTCKSDALIEVIETVIAV